MKILHDKTDKQNSLTINEFIDELEFYGIKAERKSLYTDLEILRKFGLDIELIKNKTTGYYLASGDFNIDDIKTIT